MLSSHFSPGLAPQVGQRIDKIFFSVTFITAYCAGYSEKNWSILITPRLAWSAHALERFATLINDEDKSSGLLSKTTSRRLRDVLSGDGLRALRARESRTSRDSTVQWRSTGADGRPHGAVQKRNSRRSWFLPTGRMRMGRYALIPSCVSNVWFKCLMN